MKDMDKKYDVFSVYSGEFAAMDCNHEKAMDALSCIMERDPENTGKWRMASSDLEDVDFEEADRIAEEISSSDFWDFDLLRRLCELAGMEEEWKDADDSTFECVAYEAADRLGVEI